MFVQNELLDANLGSIINVENLNDTVSRCCRKLLENHYTANTVLSSGNVLLCTKYFSDAKKTQSFHEAYNLMKEIRMVLLPSLIFF